MVSWHISAILKIAKRLAITYNEVDDDGNPIMQQIDQAKMRNINC